jgi:hypothetical protein
MSTEEELPPPTLESEVPESWSQHRPVPRAKNISGRTAAILIGSLFFTVNFSVWAVMHISREPAPNKFVPDGGYWNYTVEDAVIWHSLTTEKQGHEREQFEKSLKHHGNLGRELVGILPLEKSSVSERYRLIFKSRSATENRIADSTTTYDDHLRMTTAEREAYQKKLYEAK